MRQKRLDLLCLYPHSLGGIIVKKASLLLQLLVLGKGFSRAEIY